MSTASSFISEAFLTELPAASPDVLDAAPFGIVQVDDAGVILFYSRWESEMAGVPVERAIGKNFFSQLAPCTNNRLFFGRFTEGLERGTLDVEFDYTFTYRIRPTNVRIRLFRHKATGSNWILVRLRAT